MAEVFHPVSLDCGFEPSSKRPRTDHGDCSEDSSPSAVVAKGPTCTNEETPSDPIAIAGAAPSISPLALLGLIDEESGPTQPPQAIDGNKGQSALTAPPAGKAKKFVERPKVKGKVTKKALDAKLKWATEAELKAYIRALASSHPNAIEETFSTLTPARLPTVPVADDPILMSCFHCQSSSNLSDFHGVKVCGNCGADIYQHDTLTKQKVMLFFKFSDTEAKKLPHTKSKSTIKYFNLFLHTSTADLYLVPTDILGYSHPFCTYSMYKRDMVLREVNKKYGSLYSMVRKHRIYYR
jgi:hypothetical protein